MRLFVAICMLLIANAGGALAQSCTFTNAGLNWGTIDLTTGGPYNLTGTLVTNCTGSRNGAVRICPNFNAGSGGVNGTGSERYMRNGVNQLRYNLYRNSGRTQVWGSNTWGLPPTPPSITVNLGGGGSGSSSDSIYGQVFAGQGALPTGVYTSSFSGAHTQIAYAYTSAGNCNAIGLTNVTNVPFTTTLNYEGACTVTATDLDFGSTGALAANIDTTNTISVTCTSGTLYLLGLNGGISGATDPTQRKMFDPSNTEDVTYGIYRNSARTQPWGSTLFTVAFGVGTGAAQTFTGYGRVPPQVTPSADTYTDTIVVTLYY